MPLKWVTLFLYKNIYLLKSFVSLLFLQAFNADVLINSHKKIIACSMHKISDTPTLQRCNESVREVWCLANPCKDACRRRIMGHVPRRVDVWSMVGLAVQTTPFRKCEITQFSVELSESLFTFKSSMC